MKPQILNHILQFQKKSYVKDFDDQHKMGMEIIDCSLGVNPYGTSGLVHKYAKHLKDEDISNYPNYPYADIRRKIANHWLEVAKIDLKNVVIGSGSMNILNTINKILINKDTKVLGYCPQFTDYITNVQSFGGVYEYVQLKEHLNYKFVHVELLRQISDDYKIIYLDNPNNPTGQIIPLYELSQIIETAETMGVCVIVDEAYGDFMDKANSAISLLNKYSNLFVVRTFSKGFGLAGLRVGYMICSATLSEYYQKIDIPFCISSYSNLIAQFALSDHKFIESSIRNIQTAKARIIHSCSKIRILETSLGVPIMVLHHPDENVDLSALFYEHDVLTESGDDFLNLGRNFVRVRIPAKVDGLIHAIKQIEQEM